MFRLFLYFCVFISFSQASIEKFVYNDTSPKCCGYNEALILNTSDNLMSYKCVFDVNRTAHVLTSDVLSSFPWKLSEAKSCVDDIITTEPEKREPVKFDVDFKIKKTQLKLDYFPKCCPANSAYDMYEHKCVESSNMTDINFSTFTEEVLRSYLNEGLIYLRIGLSKCVHNSVVFDDKLPSYDEIVFEENKDITIESLNKSFPYGSYCIDKVYEEDSYVVRGCYEGFDICKKSQKDAQKPRCIRKCCPDGYMYIGGGQCRFGFTRGMNFFNDSHVLNPEEPFAIIHGYTCNHYKVDDYLMWDYTLNETGFLNLNLEENKDNHSPFEDTYCYEEVDLGVKQGRHLFLCFFQEHHDVTKFKVSRVAFSLSCIFLFLTLIGYLFLPEMQNLHGKTLMCNCGSLLLAFLILVVLQFYPTIEGPACRSVGYVVMYTFLVAFMWSNVMCFDIWWTFGSMRVHGIDQKKRECRRFLWYCIYAWSIPIPITVAACLVQHFRRSLPEAMKPIIPTLGDFNCFFEESTNLAAFLTWFILPIAIICICNMIFFIKTVRYCYQVKNEINKMKDSLLSKNERKKIITADMDRLLMATKLFLVMGIPWIFESITAAAVPVNAQGAAKIIEIFFDIINSLQGFYIFCIFILKTKFIKSLKRKLCGKYFSRPSESTSGGTASSYVATSCKV